MAFDQLLKPAGMAKTANIPACPQGLAKVDGRKLAQCVHLNSYRDWTLANDLY